MLGLNIMGKNVNENEVLYLEQKIRFIESQLNEFSKEEIINYLAFKIALEDYDFSDFPIEK